MYLENKKALVTGASRGLGRAISDRFLSAGAEVWGTGTKEPADLAERVEKAGGKFHWASFDLSDTAGIEPFIENLVKEVGGFDILVNNAGINRDKLAFRMSLEDFQSVLDINLTAAFLISRTVGREMIRKRGGSIVNMSSVAGAHGNGGQANYAASKAGLIGLSKSLARELASRNVRVNAITPGLIESDMTREMDESARAALIAAIPMKRMGTSEDVAELVLFLSSDAASYITGQVISVDGGMFI
jgi:3-oxoacyl-[acyl-carrier protein] reductase